MPRKRPVNLTKDSRLLLATSAAATKKDLNGIQKNMNRENDIESTENSLDENDHDDGDDEDDNDEGVDEDEDDQDDNEDDNEEDDGREDGDDDSNTAEGSSCAKTTKLRQEAKIYSENLERRGVIYMSRVPPFMKPNKARTLFEQFGIVTRIYLAEEDSQLRKRRKVNGGNGSKQFTEGWIEFADKKVAKSVAESLNNSTMGGMKSHFYHDDIWNLKYLKKFKWDYLTEKFAYERRVRENKLKASMMQAKRSNAEFVELVEKGKQQKYVDDRKRKHQGVSSSSKSIVDNIISNTGEKGVKRVFSQRNGLASVGAQYIDKNLLGSVFSRNKITK